MEASPHLKRSLGSFSLWGLGVGYVISGMYFGWNLGLSAGGTLGFAIALFFICLMYVSFTFSYCELACAMPKAGGAFDYAKTALGPSWGFITGMAQIIEFVLAPPAIAAGIGAYCEIYISHFHSLSIAILTYFVFTALNVYGLRAATRFELIITLLAVIQLIFFIIFLFPHFHLVNLTHHSFPNGITGIFLALPFAIWFFLGIEGVANMAEETKNPQKTILKGFGAALLTIAILSVLIFIFSVGVGGWEKIVFISNSKLPSNSPLPLALGQIINQNHFLYRTLVVVGLFGLIASFHGLTLAGGRATYEMGRMGYAPRILGLISNKFGTPAVALIFNMLIGLFALLTGKTGELITLSSFGALCLYILSMITLIKLRKTHPQMPRPFRVPFYPYTPCITLLIALCALIVMTVYHFNLALIYFSMIIIAFSGFKFLHAKKLKMEILPYEI